VYFCRLEAVETVMFLIGATADGERVITECLAAAEVVGYPTVR